MPLLDFLAGGRRPVVIGGVSDGPTSILIYQVILNTSVTASYVHTPADERTAGDSGGNIFFIDHLTMLGQ